MEWFIAISRYSNVKKAIGDIDESEWVDIGFTPEGMAQMAETTFVTKINKKERTLRL